MTAEPSHRQITDAFLESRQRLWGLAHFRMDNRLRGRVDAEDVLQEAFMAAVQRAEHFPADGSHYIWLRLIVLQTLTDIHRRHLGAGKRDVSRETTIAAGNAGNNTSFSLADCLLGRLTSPSAAAIRDEVGGQLREALEQMNAVDREVLALRHFEELTNQEVATILGISDKNASIRYVRALQRLKRILESIPGLSEAF